MSKLDLHQMTTQDLVALFAKVTVEQDDALLGNQISRFNRLFGVMAEIADELKARDGDQRTALLSLFEYPNMQVRLQAAKLTLAVAPVKAREQLEAIVSSKWFPQAGDAGMCLDLLDDGTFKPK
ncbi:hypothetical protein I8G32_01938 [Rhodopseudomonas palustris]|uniref:DUF2019 domain-containing protein n=1 Tax=Rhodopseudomonas palustris (strain ATCC BAA-98 / CGA009) TaxID=258594 RepID=Q6N8L4_RHOPA|nr:DUF2019 domain-containing protein [Rhodopseudomonas palustris]OPF94115.1 hypothetical protein B1S06_09215 [Rhodopseudomonas palustris]QQM03397.1 hypothetical protein I8G32_01938 [Rhodopseudomonas palustris]RJF62623.1 DUF2019 domain-containing protein [Rhodopseudomonas palustris]WAB79555.1 DUF2019 domain-containing protein [Rhodopseudomonas palustris]WCL92039.1 DUF2019 domain-containing protein [Rhodopseudomonas palustris CGA009]